MALCSLTIRLLVLRYTSASLNESTRFVTFDSTLRYVTAALSSINFDALKIWLPSYLSDEIDHFYNTGLNDGLCTFITGK